jgi:hypothetical protein
MERYTMRIILLINILIATTSMANGQIHINRVLVDPAGNENRNAIPEIIVLGNYSEVEAELGGWALKSTPPEDEPDHWEIPNGIVLGAGEEIAIYWHTPEDIEVDAIAGVPLTIDPILTGKDDTSLLNNDGGDLLLMDPAGASKHYVQWSDDSQGLEVGAVTAGLWTAGEFVESPSNKEWLVYDGEGYSAGDWSVVVIDNEIPTIVNRITWSTIKTYNR